MKLSDRLYEEVQDLWEEAGNKPFVVEMALGTLDKARFRYYMIQDYLYLLDYIDILKRMLKCTVEPELCSFIYEVIEQTEHEAEQVHLPNMKAAGIIIDEAKHECKAEIIAEYIDYMKQQLKKEGLLAGLTALVQCSWIYAFIGQKLTEKYSDAIALSPCRSWFESYTSKEYINANQELIDILDSAAEKLSQEETEKLCNVFIACARYENLLLDMFYNVQLWHC